MRKKYLLVFIPLALILAFLSIPRYISYLNDQKIKAEAKEAIEAQLPIVEKNFHDNILLLTDISKLAYQFQWIDSHFDSNYSIRLEENGAIITFVNEEISAISTELWDAIDELSKSGYLCGEIRNNGEYTSILVYNENFASIDLIYADDIRTVNHQFSDAQYLTPNWMIVWGVMLPV